VLQPSENEASRQAHFSALALNGDLKLARILVIGASHGIGQAVCLLAVASGHQVRAMSRSGRVPVDNRAQYEPFVGDACRSSDVARALEGIDVVVQTLGVGPSLDLLLKPVTLFSESTRILLLEMKKAGVQKLIAVTGFGAGDSAGAINVLQRFPFLMLLKNIYDNKSIQEQLIIESDLDWLIVRPGILTNGRLSGKCRVLMSAREWRNGIVSRLDVAEFIVRRISGNALGREKPVLIRVPL
jgi:uncharacterized protein YbjT (DUF2867 family)